MKSYNREAYVELKEFTSRNSVNDADSFCKNLIRESPRHKALGKFSYPFSRFRMIWGHLCLSEHMLITEELSVVAGL